MKLLIKDVNGREVADTSSIFQPPIPRVGELVIGRGGMEYVVTSVTYDYSRSLVVVEVQMNF